MTPHPPAPDPARTSSGPTTVDSGISRLQASGGSGKSIFIAGFLLTATIAAALFAKSYGAGGALTVACTVQGATTSLDSGGAIACNGSNVKFTNTPFGRRTVSVYHPDYERAQETVQVTWLGENRAILVLKPIPFTLQVVTNPGASISFDGKDLGTANSQGVFQQRGLLPGDHTLKVSLKGYVPIDQRRHFSPPFSYVSAYLGMSQERVQDLQKEQARQSEKASRIGNLITSAQRLFTARQYRESLAALNQALQLDPQNSQAIQLKSQVTQTMNILK